MKTLYCSKSLADEGCYEVSEGVFARPAFLYEQPELIKLGWVKDAKEVQPEKAKRQAKKAEQEDLLGE